MSNLKNIEDFLRIKVDHALMKYGPEDMLQVECDKCRHRKLVSIGRMQGAEEIVQMVMTWVKQQEFAKAILLDAMRDMVE